ncbi:Bor family protein [Leptospira sp. id769339]|nr:Bor family protein [Leptospira sp. id769339]
MNYMINRTLLNILTMILFGFNCRHAWVTYPAIPPEPCLAYAESSECKTALDQRKKNTKGKVGETFSMKDHYYLMGLLPNEKVVNLASLCPQGPKSVHQFMTFWDVVLEQSTLGIYSPQTLEVECYPW